MTIKHYIRGIKQYLLLLFTGSLMTLNWGLYIWAINHHYIVESSLGYYINPLFSVLFASLFLKESLNKSQKIAIVFALIGVLYFAVDYGRFPEHQLPSQMHDVAKIYLHLLDGGTNNSDIIVIGDSAGATLAMTSCLWLRDNNYPLPGHIVCFSLWADATSSGDSKITNAYTDPFYGIAKHKKIEDNLHLLRRISKYVLNVDRTDPYISPLFGSFEKFPKVTLICGTAELDESDSDRVYDKMKNANIDARLYKFEGMCHCFQLFSFLPESKKAYKLVKRRILEDTK